MALPTGLCFISATLLYRFFPLLQLTDTYKNSTCATIFVKAPFSIYFSQGFCTMKENGRCPVRRGVPYEKTPHCVTLNKMAAT